MDTDVIKLIESQVESLTQFFPIFSFNMVSQVLEKNDSFTGIFMRFAAKFG